MTRLLCYLVPRPFAQATLLAAVGVAAGLAANGVRADGVPLARPVFAASGAAAGASCEAPKGTVRDASVDEACALADAGAAFVDARPAAAFAAGHVAGAIHLPSVGDCPDFEDAIERIRAAPAVVVYDADGSCALARHLAGRLVGRGLADVRVMVGGFPGWCAADRPAEAGSCRACEHAGLEAP
jgi:rhodanese-related sulfurtransferase